MFLRFCVLSEFSERDDHVMPVLLTCSASVAVGIGGWDLMTSVGGTLGGEGLWVPLEAWTGEEKLPLLFCCIVWEELERLHTEKESEGLWAAYQVFWHVCLLAEQGLTVSVGGWNTLGEGRPERIVCGIHRSGQGECSLQLVGIMLLLYGET